MIYDVFDCTQVDIKVQHYDKQRNTLAAIKNLKTVISNNSSF